MSLQPTELEGGRVLSADDMELLQRQVEIQRQLIALAKTNGLALYRPHYLQHKFHSSAAKRRGAFTGNRFGKSKMDGAETAAWAVGERTWYKAEFDIYGVELSTPIVGITRNIERKKVWRCHHDGGENHPLVRQGIPPFATKQLIVCANWNKVEEIWTDQSADRPGYIWQFLPKGFGRGYVNHAGVIDHIVCTNGAIIDFMSVDSFKKSSLVAESSDYDRVVFDEPAPKALWKGVARGLVDRNGQADFALTALQEVWIVEKFTGDPATPTGDDDDRPFRLDLRFSFRASMLDNPHLEDQSIIDYENELTEDEKQCRINGVPLEYSGLIYKEFSHEKHVMKVLPDGWEDWTKPAPKTLLYARVDTHPVKPHAVSFYAVGPAEIPIQCHEIWLACDADTLAETINTYVRSTGCFLAGIKVEPAAWIKDPTNRTVSIAKVLSKHGLFVRPASKDLSNGILAVRSALKRQKFFITPNCTRTLWEFSRYRYDVEDGKPVDENDHFMENLYRLIIDGVKFFDPDSNNFPITDEEFVGTIDNLSNVNW
jgi:hypothetical protein